MNLMPVNEYVIIQVDDETAESKGGILIPQGTMRLPSTGTVIAISDDIMATDVEVGDRVVFLRYAALDGPEKDIRICKMEHIVGVIDDEQEGA